MSSSRSNGMLDSSRRRHRDLEDEPATRERRRRKELRMETAQARDSLAGAQSSWDGVLSSSDDVHVPVDFAWDEHRRTIVKMMFDRGGICEGNVGLKEDFWTFFTKLIDNCARSADQNESGKPRVRTIKNAVKRFHITPRNFNLVHRYQFVRGDDEFSAELSSECLKTLHYAMLCYLDFVEKQEFQKLRKLREAQANLPINNYRAKILELIQANPIVIVSGDTGCGKSTQVPQYLLKAGFDNICCTQPRRIACISLSKRVAYETLNEYGSQVAYQIRFEKTKTQHTRIVFMTEGLLLRQMGSNSVLDKYSVIVLDEVHERHLHSDFLLGIVRSLVTQRPDLRIVLMSATINIDLFAKYFDNAPVVQVPGRLFPIQVHYKPISHEARTSSRFNPGPYVRILEMIDNKFPSSERGDVLIFLSGINEITTCADAVLQYAQQTRKWIVLSLHSSLSLAEQDKVFDIAPSGVRKCIISTNIAETSVTIDGVRFVIDSGRVKEMSYDAKYHMQRLQEFWISQASAEQRRGRAGRTGPGVCYRMYQESDYENFAPFSTPEIQRVPLESLILQMLSMGLSEVRHFPFIEPPSSTAIEHCMASLKNHGAITGIESLTQVGHALASLPLDVTIGKILISGSVIFSLLEVTLFVTAALSVQTPFTNKAFRDLDCRPLLEKDFSKHGDALTLLKIFNSWLAEKVKSDRHDASRRWCKKRGVEEQRMYEMTKLCGQFREILKEGGLLNSQRLLEDSLQRKGQVKQLRFLKRTVQRTKKERKVLSLDVVDAEDEEKPGDELDIQNIEFQLENDRSNMEDMLEATGNLTEQELHILKLILCAGLYPNLAIADQCNGTTADQVFHTKSKPYVVLHPTSVFTLQPELLAVAQNDVVVGVGDRRSRGVYSDQHFLLVYVSLMETDKPYLMNCTRIKALQTLLLFSRSIDTNADCTRLVFDQWIDVHFVHAIEALDIVELAIWVRTLWERLLESRLTEARTSAVESGKKSQASIKTLERELGGHLCNFISTHVVYSMQRLMAADLKTLYQLSDEESPSSKSTRKGGQELSPYLVYNCIREEEAKLTVDMDWNCPKCEEHFHGSVEDRLTHFALCITTSSSDMDKSAETDEEAPRRPLANSYFCDKCRQTFSFTPAEILRHNKSH